MKKMSPKLLALVLALVMAGGSLIGGTIAWFTDEVTSANNVITSGTLDITLEYKDANGAWQNVEEMTTPLFSYDLWEPGYTTYKTLRVANAGSLALKYQLSLNVDAAAEAGKANLADVIDVYVVEGDAPADRAALAAMTPVGTLSEVAVMNHGADQGHLLSKAAVEGTLNAGEAAKEYTIVLKMQESAGNEYQGLSVGKGISVVLEATQYTYEEDAFGDDYDADAQLATQVATVADLKAALAEGKNVRLLNDMELKDDSIVIANDVVLDLNGKTLSGESTSSATSCLLKVNAGATVTLKNGTVTFDASKPDTEWEAGFPSYANDTISCSGTLIVDGATIENKTAPGGASYAVDCYPGANLIVNSGKLDGHGKNAIRMFANSATVPTNVTINGGEIVGSRAIWVQLPSSNAAQVPPVNVTVNGGKLISTDSKYNLAIYSYSYGQSFDNTVITLNGGEFYGDVALSGGSKNGAEKLTINQDNCKFYGKVFSYNGNATIPTVTPESGYVTDDAELAAALEGEEETIVLRPGTYTFPAASNFSGNEVINANGAVFEGNSGLNIKGATVIGATFNNNSGNAVGGTINGTFKDCEFTGSNALRYCYAGETVVFENCVFSGSTYGIHFDGGSNDVVFKNCTFSGFNAMGGAITKLTLDGCTFKANGKSGYNGINLWGDTDLINCTFVFDGTAGTEWVDLCNDNKTVTFTNCVVSNGTTERALNAEDVGDYGDGNTITIK
ncbi:MAG: hypothetical protein E7324_04200 [Clostridiales bacterium]|nr:hypothetical protein [Clostridiales bacterium]